MGITFGRMLNVACGFMVFLSSCTSKEIDPYVLCREFYQLNKNKNFTGLFDVTIGVRRVGQVFSDSLNQYELVFNTIEVFDPITQNHKTLPVFKRGTSLAEKDSIFRRIQPDTKNFLMTRLEVSSEVFLFDSYVTFVDTIYKNYYNVVTPKSYSLKNVVLEGHPSGGKFISFPLMEGVDIYYLEDPNSLTEYWKTYFGKLDKFDDYWFYEIKKVEDSK